MMWKLFCSWGGETVEKGVISVDGLIMFYSYSACVCYGRGEIRGKGKETGKQARRHAHILRKKAAIMQPYEAHATKTVFFSFTFFNTVLSTYNNNHKSTDIQGYPPRASKANKAGAKELEGRKGLIGTSQAVAVSIIWTIENQEIEKYQQQSQGFFWRWPARADANGRGPVLVSVSVYKHAHTISGLTSQVEVPERYH